MKKSAFILFVLLWCFFSPQAHAGYYQYTDNAGNTVFTDDLSKVPETQRSEVTSYKSVQSRRPDPTPQPQETASKVALDNLKNADLETVRKQLEEEHQQLEEMKKELLREKNLINTPEKQDRYNRNVRELNQRIDNFERGIKAYNDQVMR